METTNIWERKEFDPDTAAFINTISDPISRRIMADMVCGDGHITADQIPTRRIGASKVQILSRLCRMESRGLVTSQWHTTRGYKYRRYALNQRGRNLVDTHMQHEVREARKC